ncbi:C2f protein [Pavlovales sp. CCMP2436]|nr:C2f protein [Pavlovales sp. CCMP2436]
MSEPSPQSAATDDPKREKTRLIVLLERACLETAKVGKDYVLLDCDNHKNFLMKHKRNPSDYRPDILHQCLLILLDSPLNKAGMLQVYIRSQKGVLIEVNPQIRIPRTYKRFAGLMVHLLHKLSVSAVDSPAKLMRVIKNPIADHLPPGCRKISTSVKGKLTNAHTLVPSLPMDPPSIFVFGTMAHGSVEEAVDWTDECVALSEYPLSGAAAIGRLCAAYEIHLNIL